MGVARESTSNGAWPSMAFTVWGQLSVSQK
jgi:hypothetical protein